MADEKQEDAQEGQGDQWVRNRQGKFAPAPVTMEDRLIDYFSRKELQPHTYKSAAEYTGMSLTWCYITWAAIRERQAPINSAKVEAWRAGQLETITEVSEKMKELALAGDPDAARALAKYIEMEMKLTGTARPVQVQILEGPELEEFMKTLPADMIARVQAGDSKALVEVKAMMQARKAGGG